MSPPARPGFVRLALDVLDAARSTRRLEPGQRGAWRELTAGRVLSARHRALPDFLIVGAQRAGTTSLYANLVQHPLVVPCIRKEVHYFDVHHERSLHWYRAHFMSDREAAAIEASEGRRPITGEATPMYMFLPAAARRMGAALPDARLIVMLRNPIDRAISQHRVVVRRFGLDIDFAEACRGDPIHEATSIEEAMDSTVGPADDPRRVPILARGLYAYQLERLFELYPRERIAVFEAERLYRDEASVHAGALDFLGLPAFTPKSFDRSRPSEGRRDIDPGLRAELAAFFRPHNERLFELLDRRFDWD